MQEKNIVLAIDDVEPGLVAATKKLGERQGRRLRGVVLVDEGYSGFRERAKDTTGLFEEIVCDFNDQRALQAALKPYLHNILVVNCRQEDSIESFRKVVPFLPYTNTPSESALRWSTEKHLMRDRLHAYNSDLVPRYHYFSQLDVNHAKAITKDFKFPVIIKPSGLAASLLVSLCQNEAEMVSQLKKTFRMIGDIYRRDQGRGTPSVLVEEMIEGDMYSIDAYVDPHGKVYCAPLVRVFTAHSLGLEGFYNLVVITPTDMPAKEVAAAQQAATEAIHAVNLSASTAHIELFKSPTGWKIIELGPRLGGYRQDLYSEAYGIDHYYNDLAVKIGLKPEISDAPIGNAADLNIYSEHEGIIESIAGLGEARKLSSVKYLHTHALPGDMALSSINGGKLIVDGVLGNKDKKTLEADISQVLKLVKVNVKPDKKAGFIKRRIRQVQY